MDYSVLGSILGSPYFGKLTKSSSNRFFWGLESLMGMDP